MLAACSSSSGGGGSKAARAATRPRRARRPTTRSTTWRLTPRSGVKQGGKIDLGALADDPQLQLLRARRHAQRQLQHPQRDAAAAVPLQRRPASPVEHRLLHVDHQDLDQPADDRLQDQPEGQVERRLGAVVAGLLRPMWKADNGKNTEFKVSGTTGLRPDQDGQEGRQRPGSRSSSSARAVHRLAVAVLSRCIPHSLDATPAAFNTALGRQAAS